MNDKIDKNMKRIALLTVVAMLIGCTVADKGIIQNKDRLAKIESRLVERKAWLPDLEGQSGSLSEKQALDFLYAYMPVGDVADYDVQFYRDNIASTLEARKQMPWGAIVPEAEFLHFVLPVRVNNENMDTSRMVFFAELKDRVKGMSMQDAILEVNHWCHEKVSYTPTDSRTISPLGIVKNAAGRCGEQSTFTVAALRSVGIPSRQIYVPRWAHTDDNHAWVEAWAADKDGKNGRWYYLGACEPEAVLNTGWFDAPSKRSLMMNTKAFGDYIGSEEVLGSTDSFTELNVTANYAPTSRGMVVVIDENGDAVVGADVVFSIYNYASYYPTASVKSDSAGMASLVAGLGDMAVWVSKDGLTASGRLDFRSEDTLKLVLDSLPVKAVEWDLVPPAPGVTEVNITPSQRDANNRRFAAEDSIREAYIATFITRAKSDAIASEIGADSARVFTVLSESRGNHAQVAMFLLNTPSEHVGLALDLLEVISVKDLHDTPSTVLLDHLRGAAPYAALPYFKEYILNPRIDNELLTPYRSTLGAIGGCTTPEQIITIASEVQICDSLNPAGIPITVMGVHKLKMADRAAAERYTIAMLRSKGVAARREPLTGRLQYADGTSWINIENRNGEDKGKLVVSYNPTSLNDDPKLSTHFTIARFDGKQYRTVDMEDIAQDMGSGASYKALFKNPIELPEGHYMLVTGTRLADGTVLAHNEPFVIEQGRTTSVKMVMRSAENSLEVIGNINPEVSYLPAGATEPATLLSTTGRGYFVLAMVDAKKEPTTHLLRDLQKKKVELEKWGRPIVLVFRDKEQLAMFKATDFPTLPKTVSFGADVDGKVSGMLSSMLDIKDMSRLPVVTVADSFGRVFYLSTGYNISLGEQLSIIVEHL